MEGKHRVVGYKVHRTEVRYVWNHIFTSINNPNVFLSPSCSIHCILFVSQLILQHFFEELNRTYANALAGKHLDGVGIYSVPSETNSQVIRVTTINPFQTRNSAPGAVSEKRP